MALILIYILNLKVMTFPPIVKINTMPLFCQTNIMNDKNYIAVTETSYKFSFRCYTKIMDVYI